MSRKKVMVAGCFDLVHPGQVMFLRKAAALGDLYVSLGRDLSIVVQKGKSPVLDEQERKFMLENLKCVHWVEVVQDPGPLGFQEHLDLIQPDLFVINQDGHSPEKEQACLNRGIEYRVFPRDHFYDTRQTSATDLARRATICTRVSLCSGFMDNPAVNRCTSHNTGSLVVVPIEPIADLQERSGMATSTIATIQRFFGGQLPTRYPVEQLAEMIFRLENPPDRRRYISGSLDSRGIVARGINLFTYQGGTYRPSKIDEIIDESTLRWLESHVYLRHAWKRPDECIVAIREDHPLFDKFCDQLHESSQACWQAIHARDLTGLAAAVHRSHRAQCAVVENHCPPELAAFIQRESAPAAMVMGAGGGGYVAFVAPQIPDDAIRIRIKRYEL